MKKGKQGIFIGFLLVIILISLVQVSAVVGRMGNAKMILYPEVNGWTYTTIDKTILTENVNDIPINITLELSEGTEEFIELIDKSYVLQPGEEKKAMFKVKVRKEGTYNGKILVFFSSTEKGNSPGVVLNSDVTVIAKKDQNYQEINNEGETKGEQTDTEKDNSTITGNIISDEKTKNLPLTILIVSTTILAIILFILIISTKKNKSKGKKK